MKKVFLLIGMVMVFASSVNAQVLKAKSGNISFFSKTPLEDISAKSGKINAAIDISKKAVAFKVGIASFVFPNKLMQDHFNENYMETEKFPDATFSGAIQESVDLTKDGTYNVTVIGKLKIHGVEKGYTTKGTMVVKGKSITLNSKFNVALEDHKIDIPTIVVKQIAKVVEVTVDASF